MPGLVAELFDRAKESQLHPIVKGALLHYEIEIIHPFADGNGRIGRLWQILVLAKWKPLFSWIPMESVLYEKRPQYYQALRDSGRAGDSGAFIEFALSALYETIEHQVKHQVKHRVALTDTMAAVLKALESKELSRREIFAEISMVASSRGFKRHIEPLVIGGFMVITVPDKPSSRLQRYRLTKKGVARLRDAHLF